MFSSNVSADDDSWMSYFNSALTTGSSYLPTAVTDSLTSVRAYAIITAPPSSVVSQSTSKARNTVAIATIGKQQRILLASTDGYLYIYNLPRK